MLDSLHHTYYFKSLLDSVKMEGHTLSQLVHVPVQMATVGIIAEVSTSYYTPFESV